MAWKGSTQIWLAAACVVAGSSVAIAQANRQVNVYNWTDYIAEDAAKTFTAATGVKVNYTTYDTNEVLDAKLRTGRSGYDVVTPTASPFFVRQLAAGAYRPIERAKLANYGNLDPEIMAALARYDPGNVHGVPWMWGTTGIGYNIDAVKQRMPDAPVDSLRMVFDPAVIGRFRDCGVMMLDSPTDVLPAALLYLGLDPDSKDSAALEKAADVVRKVRPMIRKFSSGEIINALARGDICLAFSFSGDILQAKSRGGEAKPKAVNVEYAIPREGSQLWIDVMAIPKDAPNPEAAHRWIDYLLTPKVAAASSEVSGYANANKEALATMKPEITGNPLIYPTAEMRRKLYTISSANADQVRNRTRLWTNLKTGK